MVAAMADILIRAASSDDLDEIVGKLGAIINFTGGYPGVYDENDRLEELEVRLIAPRASEEELTELWDRVKKGEDPKAAWKAVQGPSYHYWNYRRELHERLRATNLEGMDLSGEFLPAMDVEFQGKNLRNANLCRSDLRHSDFTATDLTGADLSEADLSGTNLAGANLENVTLTDARYDAATRWPAGFDPARAGAVLVEQAADS
jgi:hypothetical protein